jgi:hypothetical protein
MEDSVVAKNAALQHCARDRREVDPRSTCGSFVCDTRRVDLKERVRRDRSSQRFIEGLELERRVFDPF